MPDQSRGAWSDDQIEAHEAVVAEAIQVVKAMSNQCGAPCGRKGRAVTCEGVP